MSSQQAFLRRARFTCLLQFTDIFCTLPVYVTHRDPQTVLHLEMPGTALTEGSIVPPDPGHRLQQMENTSVHNSSKPQHSLAAALHPCCVIPALQCSAGLAWDISSVSVSPPPCPAQAPSPCAVWRERSLTSLLGPCIFTASFSATGTAVVNPALLSKCHFQPHSCTDVL